MSQRTDDLLRAVRRAYAPAGTPEFRLERHNKRRGETKMLHMVVNTHSAESCAFRNEANKDALLGSFEKMPEAAEALGIEIKEMWANMAAHTVFALIDAPNAHVIDEQLRDAGLVGQTSTQVYAVETMEAATAAVESQ